jgi:hypothetical protein
MKRTCACFLVFCLGQQALAGVTASGHATVGGAPVSWSTVSDEVAQSLGVEPPLSLIMFTFVPQVVSPAISDAQWASEAARQGTDVATIKMILGRSVYVTVEGHLASCTTFAIEAGSCGEVEVLSVPSRAAVAQSILEQSGECRWIGFDPALHERAAYQAGAEFASLWVAADCR